MMMMITVSAMTTTVSCVRPTHEHTSTHKCLGFRVRELRRFLFTCGVSSCIASTRKLFRQKKTTEAEKNS